MKKLLSISLLIASCSSEQPVNFNIRDYGIVCDNMESLNIQLNECLSESCHYQVPVDSGISNEDMDTGVESNDYGMDDDNMSEADMNIDQTQNIVNLGPECNSNIEEVLDKCRDIFAHIADCKKGISNRDAELDFDLSDMSVDKNLNN